MPPDQQTDAPHVSSVKADSKATTSFVLGIIGIFAWFIPLIGLPVTITGLVKGIRGLQSTKRTTAIIGITLCIIGLVLTIINAAIAGSTWVQLATILLL